MCFQSYGTRERSEKARGECRDHFVFGLMTQKPLRYLGTAQMRHKIGTEKSV